MSDSERSRELENRTLSFSKDIVKLCRKHQRDIVLQPLLKQLIRSATSIGANYAEANNASSKADFKNKIFIAKKESAETRYWLKLIRDEVEHKSEVDALIDEASELLMIFQRIVSTMRSGK